MIILCSLVTGLDRLLEGQPDWTLRWRAKVDHALGLSGTKQTSVNFCRVDEGRLSLNGEIWLGKSYHSELSRLKTWSFSRGGRSRLLS